jgi:hypothetical protein
VPKASSSILCIDAAAIREICRVVHFLDAMNLLLGYAILALKPSTPAG